MIERLSRWVTMQFARDKLYMFRCTCSSSHFAKSIILCLRIIIKGYKYNNSKNASCRYRLSKAIKRFWRVCWCSKICNKNDARHQMLQTVQTTCQGFGLIVVVVGILCATIGRLPDWNTSGPSFVAPSRREPFNDVAWVMGCAL